MMPTSQMQAFFVHSFFRLARFVPPVHSYFAMMKYKPKPFYGEGFLLADTGLGLTGRMAPQPTLEMLDRSRVKLDDLMGADFALVAYGEDAQRVIAQTQDLDFGFAALRRVAVTPMRVNLVRDFTSPIPAGRDMNDIMGRLEKPGRELLLLVRPDRYIAAAIDAPRRCSASTSSDKCRQTMCLPTWMAGVATRREYLAARVPVEGRVRP
jgi:3-(3-hydroxy-phenyl)propionate hydroxylase